MLTAPEPAHALAAPLLAAYTHTPAPGDIAADATLYDERGRTLNLFEDAFAGRTLLIAFCGSLADDATRERLTALAAREASLEALGANLVVVSSDTSAPAAREAKRASGLQAPICGDATGAVFAQYGLCKGRDIPERIALRLVVVTAQRQVRLIMEDDPAIEAAENAARDLHEEGRRAEGWIPGHAPVLIVPHALDPEDCRDLIAHFESQGEFRIDKPPAGDASDYKLPVYDYNRQDRVDHVIKDAALARRIDEKLNARVIPMIAKAFAFQVTRREDLHIARYAGAREGVEVGHRDNVAPATAYRRFALSISLNDDYEGGELVFREYAEQGYRGAPGTALVFSSALLHEIAETTRGVRYNLISHFFNDQSLQQAGRATG
ncbi:hypothetical protein DDZ18_03290 [Marinicauda salina]|uniref:Fe2OG dioxygenase domain-containing protein n=1 Tax=Marinicauda salina TaxID=2135793 RepID=A0A2U2BX94_9PROT|nr:redoxin domain-containing protein [Marinicauda salina]PWE18636.1 hypothetical protein DDZ18_03290 [Marinicauda salina]